jgi:hypothetical protein
MFVPDRCGAGRHLCLQKKVLVGWRSDDSIALVDIPGVMVGAAYGLVSVEGCSSRDNKTAVVE